MRTLLIASIVLISLHGTSFSQPGGRVALYADDQMQSCEIVDIHPGIVLVHVFHIGIPSSTGIQFYAPTPECWTGSVWLGDVFPSNAYGGTQNAWYGITLAHGACLNTPIYLGWMSFTTLGTGDRCCLYQVFPPEGEPSGWIAVVDCHDNKLAGGGRDAVINPDGSCPCDLPVPTEQLTWGRIKSLYR